MTKVLLVYCPSRVWGLLVTFAAELLHGLPRRYSGRPDCLADIRAVKVPLAQGLVLHQETELAPEALVMLTIASRSSK